MTEHILHKQKHHALVIGAGRSGIAATQLLHQHGHRVTLFDEQPLEKLKFLKPDELVIRDEIQLAITQIPLMPQDFSCVIVSPGVPAHHALLVAARKFKLPIMSEIDVGMAYSTAKKIIGITGTNGKSTTTVMMETILNAAGKNAIACGNLGRPFCDVVREINVPVDLIVLELSSFQLETSAALRLDGAIIVNITPDHLDRHESFAAYVAAKLRIAKLLRAHAPLIVHESLANLPFSSPPTALFSGADYAHGPCAFLKDLPLRGFHNHENAVAAATLSRALSISDDDIYRGLTNFKALPHRCEIVLEKNGVLFVNDSKGTTVEAVKKALDSFAQPTHLLLGGLAKGEDFSALNKISYPQVKDYYVYGRDHEKISGELKLSHAYTDLAHALRTAIKNAQRGDVVLLSPGCASFDQFEDYQHRGEVFKKLATEIMGDLCE